MNQKKEEQLNPKKKEKNSNDQNTSKNVACLIPFCENPETHSEILSTEQQGKELNFITQNTNNQTEFELDSYHFSSLPGYIYYKTLKIKNIIPLTEEMTKMLEYSAKKWINDDVCFFFNKLT